MYEGRNAQLFHPATGVITWMSNPAQPSFVWQLYHYDLEPNSSLFAVKKASELVHIQFNEATGELQVINNLPDHSPERPHTSSSTTSTDLSPISTRDNVTAPSDAATTLGKVGFPPHSPPSTSSSSNSMTTPASSCPTTSTGTLNPSIRTT